MKRIININNDVTLIALNGEDKDKVFDLIDKINNKSVDKGLFKELTGYTFEQLYAYGLITDANSIISDLIPFRTHLHRRDAFNDEHLITRSFKCYAGCDWETYNPTITVHESPMSAVNCIHKVLNTTVNINDEHDRFMIKPIQTIERFDYGILIDTTK